MGPCTRGAPPAHRSERRRPCPHAGDGGRRRAGRSDRLHSRKPAGTQTSKRWSLTAVVSDARLGEVSAALARVHAPQSSTARPIDRRGRRSNRGGPTADGDRRPPGSQHRVDLPRGRLGTRRCGPAERGPHTDRGRLRGRGPAAARGRPRRPRLKPDYSPDFLLSSSYVGRPLAIGAGLAGAIPHIDASGPAELEHAYALCALRSGGRRSCHVAEVLCHRSGDDRLGDLDVRHVQEALARRGERASVTTGTAPGTYCVQRSRPARPASAS